MLEDFPDQPHGKVPGMKRNDDGALRVPVLIHPRAAGLMIENEPVIQQDSFDFAGAKRPKTVQATVRSSIFPV